MTAQSLVTLPLRSAAGADLGTIAADQSWFGIEPNMSVLHQVVTAQLAARRSGTQSTKTRAEVARSGRKSRRQKGGGTSRQGSMRSPNWIGGGVALGPKPRKYVQRTPKKMVNLALRSALSDRASDGHVLVINEFIWSVPKTKDGLVSLKALGVDGRVLLVCNPSTESELIAAKSLRNVPAVQLIDAGELNAYDVLLNDWIVFTQATVPGAPASEESK